MEAIWNEVGELLDTMARSEIIVVAVREFDSFSSFLLFVLDKSVRHLVIYRYFLCGFGFVDGGRSVCA